MTPFGPCHSGADEIAGFKVVANKGQLTNTTTENPGRIQGKRVDFHIMLNPVFFDIIQLLRVWEIVYSDNAGFNELQMDDKDSYRCKLHHDDGHSVN